MASVMVPDKRRQQASRIVKAIEPRKEYDIPTENGGGQTGDRQSDNFIVLLKSGNADRGKEVTQ